MSLTQIVLRLAGSPGNPYGDDDQGYILAAPLDDDGRLDFQAWERRPKACTAVRFRPGNDRHGSGRLCRRADDWFVHYDAEGENGDEAIDRLGEQLLTVGQHVAVRGRDGRSLAYRISEHHPVGCDPLKLSRAAAREASAEW
jgi:hypothetical protein